MKHYILIAIILLTVSCKVQQDVNKTAPYKKSVILLGPATEGGFSQAPFSSWYTPNYEKYVVDSSSIETLKPLLKNVKIKAFMGTWCGDSKRETPAFYKIMEAANIKDKQIELITVSRQKDTPTGLEKGLNITNVPTFIFYKDGKEINRIVEYPIESLEKDMISILTTNTYKHAYSN